MNDQHDQTGTGAPQAPIDDDVPEFNPRGKRIYVPIKEGTFTFPWGAGEVKLQHLAGRYLGHEITWDWGKPEKKIKQGWRIVVELKTRDFGVLHVQASTNGMIAFLYLCGALDSFGVEQPIGLQLSQGDQGENPVTFVWPYRYDRAVSDWVQLDKDERKRWTGQNNGEYDIACKEALDAMRNHPGRREASGSINYELDCVVRSHPTKGMVAPKEAGDTAPAQAAAPSQTPTVAAATAPAAQPVAQPNQLTAAAAGLPVITPPELIVPNPFKHTPARLPSPEGWNALATERQVAAVDAKIAALTWEGLPLDFSQVPLLKTEILLRLYGMRVKDHIDRSSAILAIYDFLTTGTPEAIQLALHGACEYDPFADN